MPSRSARTDESGQRLSFWMLIGLLVLLLVAGGASRADVAGQIVVRLASWLALIAWLIWAAPPGQRRGRPVGLIIAGAAALAAVQLIPLPPAIWIALPGRELLARAAEVIGQPQPWRPISMAPGGTVNALASLVVPAAVFALASSLRADQQRGILSAVLILALTSSLVALAQFSGAIVANPLINGVPGAVSGTFANRNHLALFGAIGLVLAFGWAFGGKAHMRWRAIAAFGCALFLILIILATGSRTGIVLAVIGGVLGVAMSRRGLASQLRLLPRWAAIGLVAVAAAILVGLVASSILLDRAAGVSRAATLASAEDLRLSALPTVLAMASQYFPFGSGLGTFDPVYRISEPAELLSTSYFNHAHNDWLEIVLEGGLAGAVLLLSGTVWWARQSWAAWRERDRGSAFLRRAGSGIILLIFIASATDYPARTPMIMAVLVLAALWLRRAPAQAPSPHAGDRSA